MKLYQGWIVLTRSTTARRLSCIQNSKIDFVSCETLSWVRWDAVHERLQASFRYVTNRNRNIDERNTHWIHKYPQTYAHPAVPTPSPPHVFARTGSIYPSFRMPREPRGIETSDGMADRRVDNTGMLRRASCSRRRYGKLQGGSVQGGKHRGCKDLRAIP